MTHVTEIDPEGRNLDSKVDGANMGPTWILLAPDEPYVGPINLATRAMSHLSCEVKTMPADDLVTQGARAFAVMVLT